MVPSGETVREVLSAIVRELHDAGYWRQAALAFLKATVEDVHKTIAERTDAARTLLMHSTEGK